ncbi:periplasmic nitrate reductase, NapE protein [Zooshikella sp. RANM57]|uniref:periplasmic nitrate reductase, NapE protein n=1 Tax=Zooshikella sp. RANM57 TaxID=3425863 RepID=UPI003D6DD72D
MTDNIKKQKHEELLLFLFLTVILAPLLSVIFVGGFGFIVWISQILTGPPGPPG